MKGYELLKNIAEGIIKQGAEIKEYKNNKLNEIYILKTTIQEKDTGYEMYNNHLYEKEYTYFVNNPEENKGIKELEIIIQGVSYCDGKQYTKLEPASAIDMQNKINELVRAVNKINKEREEK